MNTQDYGDRRLGWHWLWFAPLCVAVLLFVESHTIPHAFQLIKLAIRRWTWAVLLSPSYYFCLGSMMASVFLPIQAMLVTAQLVVDDEIANRRLYAAMIIVAVLLLPFVTDALIWGSFPLIIDQHGLYRIRMIPFFPWPDGHYNEF